MSDACGVLSDGVSSDDAVSSSCGNESLAELFQAVQFVLRMLKARRWQFAVPVFMTSWESFKQFAALTNMFGHDEERGGTYPALVMAGSRGQCKKRNGRVRDFVVIFQSDTLKKQQAGAVVQEHASPQQHSSRVLVVVQPAASSQPARALLQAHFQRVETFTYLMCVLDCIRNPFVPVHRKLGRAEKREVLQKMPLKTLNKILKDDPVVKWFGWKKNAVIEVRQPRLCGFLRNYRVVV